MAEQEQDRTEQASPFKLKEARKKGQVSRSLDFNTFVMVWGLLLGALVWGEELWRRVGEASTAILAGPAAPPPSVAAYFAGFRGFLSMALGIVLPIAVVGLLFGLLSNLVQSGPVLSGEPLKPKLERINPVAGFKRLYSKRVLFEALKSVLKLALFASIIFFFFAGIRPDLGALSSHDVRDHAAFLGDAGVSLVFRLALALTLVGLLDLLYVRWTYSKQMMMSRRELKEEVKRREGDPLIRAKLRELQRERRKQAQSVTRVKDADVLITNPTHLAVALKYVPGEMDAPRVIAKGSEAWAEEMRRVGARLGIPIVHRPRLARRLFRRTPVDGYVPPETFLEVARVYASVSGQRRGAVRVEVAQ